MTGIVRDEALRGDALAGALASSEKKTERERISERERERIHGEPTRAENERRDTWRRIGKRAKDDNLGAEWSCRLSAAVLKVSIVSKKLGYLSKLAANGYLTIAKVTHCESSKFLRESLRYLTRYGV